MPVSVLLRLTLAVLLPAALAAGCAAGGEQRQEATAAR